MRHGKTAALVWCFLLPAAGDAAAQNQGPPAGMFELVPPGIFELTPEQRQAIHQARRDLHARRCEITGAMVDAQDDLRELYARPERNAEQIGDAFRRLADLRQQLLAARIAAENRAAAALTAEQRNELYAWRRGQRTDIYPESLPYVMHPGMPPSGGASRNLEAPATVPAPPSGEAAAPP